MKVKRSITRRDFLRNGALALAGITVLPRRVLGAPGEPSPNEELTKAIVGVGGMGRGHIGMPGARLVAVCDVDSAHLEQALTMSPEGTKGYRDFREVLERPDVDIVHVPTPPHWHALITIAAAEAGKDVWCEKPMTRTIGEGKKVVEAIQRNGRI
ncbi:MAG TPA: Gfo/Idh/MocA family oxidoreductase, partial [Candidatus Hydrogenedentes bacterium]|nr:Gfo/Idh/MocA family oxidoreductase [Candidatus Hydrogenedentota bacterium]